MVRVLNFYNPIKEIIASTIPIKGEKGICCFFFSDYILEKTLFSLNSVSSPENEQKNLQFFSSFQGNDLLYKVITAVAFYFTYNLSLYRALENILSHSETVSKVALPILKKIFSSPHARFLPSSHLIILAPVLLKLLQICLARLEDQVFKRNIKVLEVIKQGADKISGALDTLSNLRFTLLCLGMIPQFSLLIQKFLLSQADQLLIPPEAKRFKSWLGWIIFLYPSNKRVWPNQGLNEGLQRTYKSFRDFLAPTFTAESLTSQINQLQHNTSFNDLTQLKNSVDNIKIQLKNSIKIPSKDAKKLEELLNERLADCLCHLFEDSNFNNQVLNNKNTFRSIFDPLYPNRILLFPKQELLDQLILKWEAALNSDPIQKNWLDALLEIHEKLKGWDSLDENSSLTKDDIKIEIFSKNERAWSLLAIYNFMVTKFSNCHNSQSMNIKLEKRCNNLNLLKEVYNELNDSCLPVAIKDKVTKLFNECAEKISSNSL